jgi:filamentous hemagglutinin family protein
MIAKISLSFIAIVLSGTSAAQAQIYQPSNRIPLADNTLGTQVTGANNNFTINGGLTRGSSILHSFQDFSVPTGGSATFTTGVGTQAVVSRVTGNLSSDINGIINTQGANFFLINPNGVVFGPNAQLNVGSSFVTTTANSATLSDSNGTSYTFGTRNITDAPLLSVNQNVGLNVTRLNFLENSAPIINYANLQTNNPSQYIGLIGGDIILDAGDSRGNILAPGGRVDIGGLRSAGTVAVNNQGFVYNDGNVTGRPNIPFLRSDLTLIDGARVDVATNQPVNTVNRFFFPNADGSTNNSTSPGSVINIDVNNVRIINRVRTIPPLSKDVTAATDATDPTVLLNSRRVRLLKDREQVVQSCEAGENKLSSTGRGGLPTNANDPLSGDVIWRDPRSVGSQNTAKISDAEAKLPPPAIGWAMNSHGKVTLLAAKSGEILIAPLAPSAIDTKISCLGQ